MTSSIEIDDNCPICTDVFSDPWRLAPCNHTFCSACIQRTWDCAEKGKRECPFCRSAVNKIDKACTEIHVRLESIVSCKCGMSMPKKLLRGHKEKCGVVIQGLQEEQNLAKGRHQDLRENDKTGGAAIPENRVTFQCPLCPAKNLTCKDLVEHCTLEHGRNSQAAVCPVCASMPWGDPNRKSGNFIGHLKLRHKFEYNEFVDYGEYEGMGEDQVLQAILQQSLAEK